MGIRRFSIEVPGPFSLDLTVWTLRRRPHNGVDLWDGRTWRRSVTTADGTIGLAVAQARLEGEPRLEVAVECPRPPSAPWALAEARRFVTRTLGLEVDLAPFYRLARRDRRLTALAQRFRGMRPPRFPSVFEALVNAVACQQLSLTVGIHLLNRLASHFGSIPAHPGAPPAFPTAAQLAVAEPARLRALGFSGAKARTLVTIAQRVASGELDPESLNGLEDEAARDLLVRLPGIGRWSAEYILLRGLGRLRVLPGDDVGARNNLRRRFGLGGDAGYDAVAELSRSWSPFGGLVYFHLLLDHLADQGYVETPRFF